MSALRILVVDDRPDSILFLTEFLLARQHRVETCGNGSEALEAVMRRQRTNESYDLVISDVTMPIMDGLSLLAELRRRHIMVPLALYTGYGAMNPSLSQQATQLGCLAVLDKPLELRRIERLIEEILTRRSGTQSTSRDQPFFGTSRVARPQSSTFRKGPDEPSSDQPRTGALERKSGPPAPGQPPELPTRPPPVSPPGDPPQRPPGKYPSTAITRRSAEPSVKTGYVRQPTGLFLHQTSSTPKQNTTGRIRRSISGSHLPPPTGGQTPPPGGQTPPPPVSPSSRAVSCAHCQRVFLVLAKPEIYNAVCVHCGGLNRIDPL